MEPCYSSFSLTNTDIWILAVFPLILFFFNFYIDFNNFNFLTYTKRNDLHHLLTRRFYIWCFGAISTFMETFAKLFFLRKAVLLFYVIYYIYLTVVVFYVIYYIYLTVIYYI